MIISENETLKLRSGRVLGYAQYGTASGAPVLYFTGGNSSRLEGRWFAAAAGQMNVHLVVPDRPGFGLSEFQPGRRFLDWPADVAELADHLQLPRFAIFGLSGGSPHVAATLHGLPGRVARAAIVSGVVPPHDPARFRGMWPPVRMIFFLASRLPPLNRVVLKQMGGFYANPERMRQRMLQALPEPDRALIQRRPEILEIFSAAAQEAHRQGLDGDAWEWHLYVRPWGFNLSEITQEVGLWYGLVDGNVPPVMGEIMARSLPNSRLQWVADGGHFSTINNHIQAILDYLSARNSI